MPINTKTQIKVYDKLWNFKKTLKTWINWEVIWDIRFSESINWGQNNLSIWIKAEYYDDSYLQWDIVEIRISNSDNLSWVSKYTWIIEDILRNEDERWQTITLVLLWVFTAFNDILYDNWWKVFTKDDDPANIIKEIINNFNTKYWSLAGDVDNLSWNLIRFTWSSIDNFWSNVNVKFDHTDSLSAIKQVLDVSTDFYFFIDRNWVFFFKKKPITSTHTLTFNKNINSIKNKDTKKDLVNRLFLERDWWTIKEYNDVPSQTKYWIKEDKVVNSDLLNVATSDIFALQFFKNNAEVIEEVNIIINQEKTDSIIPWDTVKTQNTLNKITNLQVNRVNYWDTTTELNIEKFVWFWETVIKS